MEDQRELAAAMLEVCSKAQLPTLPRQKQGLALLRLFALAGLTGRASTVRHVGVELLHGRWASADQVFDGMVSDGVPVYRGGQRPGSIAPRDVGRAVQQIQAASGKMWQSRLAIFSASPHHDVAAWPFAEQF